MRQPSKVCVDSLWSLHPCFLQGIGEDFSGVRREIQLLSERSRSENFFMVDAESGKFWGNRLEFLWVGREVLVSITFCFLKTVLCNPGWSWTCDPPASVSHTRCKKLCFKAFFRNSLTISYTHKCIFTVFTLITVLSSSHNSSQYIPPLLPSPFSLPLPHLPSLLSLVSYLWTLSFWSLLWGGSCKPGTKILFFIISQ